MAGTTTSTLIQWARRVVTPDVIGKPECPIMHRWTLFPLGYGSASASNVKLRKAPDWLPKLLLHHFMPLADERHLHDHPRSFWTLVLRGGYDDLVPCSRCHGYGEIPAGFYFGPCPYCKSTGAMLGDVMRPGILRYRPATHAHRTRVHPGGAWTLVFMGPLQREWGFLVDGWTGWRDYFARYGYGMQCN